MKYIPGDLVEYQGKIYKITNSGDYYQISPFMSRGLEETEFHPVKLTPQILEKNGWIKTGHCIDEDYFEWYTYRKQYVTLWYYPKDGCFSEPQYDTQIMYTHELQHFLLGLGLESEIKIEEI